MNSNILVIDDEESIRINFKAFLEEEGHNILTAEGFDSAMGIISKIKLDLVIADIILGGHTGIDVLRAIKKLNRRCPVIMITGEPNIETSTEAVRLGAFDYLTKPVRKAALLKVVRQALYQKGLKDEKERYRSNLEAIFRSLESAIITVNNDMQVLEANEATKTVCGFSPQEIIGKTFNEVQRVCNKSCYAALSETLRKGETIKEFRVECEHVDYPSQVVVANCSPLLDRDNKSMGAVLLIRDVTRLIYLERELSERHKFHDIIGKSKRMQNIFKLLEDLSDFDTTVLITGESGTGKELISKALHYNGMRAGKPFVSVNCSALAENLLESELFGHVKGAFTGAVNNKVGRFQLAHGGTIFLDEIGDISHKIQKKLLRVLQEKEFEKVGESNPVKVDVRIIAATNCDLKKELKLGHFREDLYYRLKVVQIELPPLRRRVEDLPPLIEHIVSRLNRKFKKSIEGVDDTVLHVFMRYPWPGNIRELEHALEYAFILCRDRVIEIEHLPSEIKDFVKTNDIRSSHRLTGERERILQTLNDTDWNKAKAARILGISRPTLYGKIEEYNLIPYSK